MSITACHCERSAAISVRAIVAVGLLLTIVSTATAKYSGGSGTADDPYQIATAADLIALGEDPNDYGKHFILIADIDLDPNLPGRRVFDRAVIAPDVNDADGHQGSAFIGVFDGNRHVIRNLHIQGGGYLGLFGRAFSPARISNLGLEPVDVNGTGACIGGLVGYNYGSITASYTSGTVSGTSAVGGLVGVGGPHPRIVWYGSSLIASCYSTASVSGDGEVGGLVGFAGKGSIRSSYSTGSVTATERGGGLIGAIVGTDITSCFWDVETSDQVCSDGGFGLTTAEMMNPNILGLIGLAGDPNWVLDAGRDYPRLAWEGTPGQVIPEPVIDWLDGDGTEQEPYRIGTADQLILLGRASALWDKHFVLGADIDLDPNLPGRKIFHQAVIAPSWTGVVFTGVFDGKGHTISHLTIRGGGYLGLFGQTGPEAEISNLGLEAVNVNGTDMQVGGLVGFNNGGSITNCYSSGTVIGSGSYVGGLVGINDRNGSITNCYSSGAVSGNSGVGGLVCSNSGSITTCYSSGTVSGDGEVGSLVCYNSGSITSSVWDMDASRTKVSDGGVGLTTAEMMDPYMLGLNGFANDPNWVLDAGRDYPRLAWEGTPGQIIPEPVIDWLAGQGTEQEPYRVDTADQLILLARAGGLWDRHFVLGADIDLDPNLPGRRVFSQAVIPSFSGIFDGNGHTISHLTIRGGKGRLVGLFRQTASGARVSNLGLEDVDVNGGEHVGGLVGSNSGTITNCYSSGAISGSWRVGGLAGFNSASITNCHSTASVNGGYFVGGLVGEHNGPDASITNCYSSGSVSGQDSVGGLVGFINGGSIADSYSRGPVSGAESVGGLVGICYGSITASFWDTLTSGQPNMCGGHSEQAAGCDNSCGKTTAEMQMAHTFLEAGWDFVDETANGTKDLWWILEGQGCPRLWWELSGDDVLTPADSQ